MSEVPDDWDDTLYLSNSPDVAEAVTAGRFDSGYAHFVAHGLEEGRPPAWVWNGAGVATRFCLDPWQYLEVNPDLDLKPCCNQPPLEQWSPGTTSINEQRDSSRFRDLREDLLSGNLSPACARCHIRPLVPVERFVGEMERMEMPDRLAAMPVRQLRIELTTQCNLRCVYCAVSQPGYKGRHMTEQAMDDILAWVEQQPRGLDVMVNGHGETTFHPGWRDFCDGLAQRDCELSIITNFARPLDEDEARCLAAFKRIQISMESVDPGALRNIRRRVKLDNIVVNIEQVRAQAAASNLTGPAFGLSCGVYDRSVAGMPGVADFAVAQRMSSVTFWQLVKYADIPGALNVRSIPSLSIEARHAALAAMDRALATLGDASVSVTVAGNFLEEWRRLANLEVAESCEPG